MSPKFQLPGLTSFRLTLTVGQLKNRGIIPFFTIGEIFVLYVINSHYECMYGTQHIIIMAWGDQSKCLDRSDVAQGSLV